MDLTFFTDRFGPQSEEMELLRSIDPHRLPRHVAVIMDGNGRWAARHGKPRAEGHHAGAESVRRITETGAALGLEYLTLYAFSVENWKRPKTEVRDLMSLLRRYSREELPTLMRNNIRFRTVGKLSDLGAVTRRMVAHTVRTTEGNTGMVLSLALNYGARTEIVDAVIAVAREVRAGRLAPDAIDASVVERHLYTAGIPDPDLLIRTSGEYRVSNFLLWQIAYTEFVILPVLWPDFQAVDLLRSIGEFQRRDRRFGGVTQA
ncbi:MAG: isoprenyl transferase [Acidobacteria bacterium]|nr:isoprenyl transferase [Acidobacteriota bacterium]